MASGEPPRQGEGLSSQLQESGIQPENGAAPRTGKKRRGHRAGKKHKKHKPQDLQASVQSEQPTTSRTPFYRMGPSGAANLSETSLASEALLDHRYVFDAYRNVLPLTFTSEQTQMRPRRDSRAAFNQDMSTSYRLGYSNPYTSEGPPRRRRPTPAHESSDDESDNGVAPDSRTPLLASTKPATGSNHALGYGLFYKNKGRRSNETSRSSKHRRPLASRELSQHEFDVNNPPSVPPSPRLGPDVAFDDVLAVPDDYAPRPAERRATVPNLEHIIDIDGDASEGALGSTPPSPRMLPDLRRHTMPLAAEGDVCFPVDGLSEIAEEDYLDRENLDSFRTADRRRRAKQWPNLSVLEDWSREEKEERSEGIRAKRISEPVFVDGRLRLPKTAWHRSPEEAPYRFTYFNEEFESTIHSLTISELVQPGQTFRELFIPDPPELDYSSSEDEDDYMSQRNGLSPYGASKAGTRQSSVIGDFRPLAKDISKETLEAKKEALEPKDTIPLQEPPSDIPFSVTQDHTPEERPKRYGQRPSFWLDVLSPTEAEMRVIARAFGIHPLTAEDIIMQEAREKVELFRNYYFVSYRSFEQDSTSEDYLEPVNMYVVVFREGIISFHFSMSPHPNNVRRRIRQLKSHLALTSDWISYAMVDDITDAFGPLIQSIEEEVDEIDDAILELHTNSEFMTKNFSSSKEKTEKSSIAGEQVPESGGDMLRHIGQARKKVMGLSRLLGNKADVIKGFAKRCNENWDVAPRSDIGMFLGDIQDHLLTMTGNLSHYET